MIKQGAIYLILSIVFVLLAHYINYLIIYIDLAYTYINLQLSFLLKDNIVGTHARNILSLMTLPLILGGIPALIWRAIKGKPMPYFLEIVWLLWLLIAISKLLIR